MPTVLLTTVSCSTLSIDVAECDLSSGIVTEEQVLPPRAAPKVRREQANTSATPKFTPARATGQPGSGDAPKKASTPPRRDGQDVQKDRELFKEFLEWRQQTGL
jgi:hypothetical protein